MYNALGLDLPLRKWDHPDLAQIQLESQQRMEELKRIDYQKLALDLEKLGDNHEPRPTR